MSFGVLYISYDGILEPLGQSQVLSYLRKLALNRNIHLISFEKVEDWKNRNIRDSMLKEIAAAGIFWHPLRYHKRPNSLATLWDILCGTILGLCLVIRYQIQIIHARSYVASVMALALKRLTSAKFLFDMRGFWADERVDGDLLTKNSLLYKTAKWCEKQFLLNADVVVSLTEAAVKVMRQYPYLKTRMPTFEVITTCTDLDLFKPNETEQLVCEAYFNLGYVGSVSVSYLFDEVLQCFNLLRQEIPNARLHILNRGEHGYIRNRLKYHNIDIEIVRLEATDHIGVVSAMCQMNAGIFFIKQVHSKIASAPTKLGEFLGCGVPCLSNEGVGDMASILEGKQVGVAVNNFDESSMKNAILRLLHLTREPDIKQRCQKVAHDCFSLDIGVDKYSNIYDSLMGRAEISK